MVNVRRLTGIAYLECLKTKNGKRYLLKLEVEGSPFPSKKTFSSYEEAMLYISNLRRQFKAIFGKAKTLRVYRRCKDD